MRFMHLYRFFQRSVARANHQRLRCRHCDSHRKMGIFLISSSGKPLFFQCAIYTGVRGDFDRLRWSWFLIQGNLTIILA